MLEALVLMEISGSLPSIKLLLVGARQHFRRSASEVSLARSYMVQAQCHLQQKEPAEEKLLLKLEQYLRVLNKHLLTGPEQRLISILGALPRLTTKQ